MSSIKPLVLQDKAFIKMIHWMAQFANLEMEYGLWVEAMGIMYCKETHDKYIIVDAEGITSGNLVYVETSPQQLAEINRIESQLQKDDPQIFAGGWFHSHPGHDLFYSGTDTANQSYWQNSNPNGVGLVFDLTKVSETFIGFKFFRLDGAQSQSYHEVPYTLYGFTEETLIEAFKPVGIDIKTIHRLAKHLGLKTTEGIVEFDKIEVPDTQDPVSTAQKYAKEAKTAYYQGNLNKALKGYRIANLLLKEVKDAEYFELYVKICLKLAELCVMNDYPETARALIKDVKLLTQKMGLKPNLYVGKAEILLGYLAEINKDLEASLMHFNKAKTLFEKGKLYDRAFKAEDLMGGIQWKLNNREEALKNFKDALYHLTMAENKNVSKKSPTIWKILKKGLNAKIRSVENQRAQSGIEKV